MTATEFTELRRAIGQLRQSVAGLQSRYGDVAAVKRLVNDVDRLEIDASELGDPPSIAQPRTATGDRSGVVVVPDTPYDESLWHGADDEGVGGYRPQHP